MSKTGLVYHSIFLQHETGPYHPESPERLRVIVAALKQARLWENLRHLDPEAADIRWVLEVHSAEYVERVKALSRAGGGALDPDTQVSPRSYEVALHAVGGVLRAVDAIVSGELQNCFCAIRPPGHHACRNRGMGFCLFNNVAIAARYAQRRHGLGRVLIVDWDVHHGNGTQEAFYNDPSVFYFSVHQFPHYPGTGRRDERGLGDAAGTTLNVPLPPGADDETYEKVFEKELLPSAMEFGPELVLVSAGFDAQAGDYLGGMRITEKGYQRLTEIVCHIAASTQAAGRVVSVLEGGYALDRLGQSVVAHVRALVDCAGRGPEMGRCR